MTSNIDIIKDFSKLQADVNSLSKSNVALVNKVYKLQEERDQLKEQLESHGPEGHNCTNLQVFTIRTKLDNWRKCAEELAEALKELNTDFRIQNDGSYSKERIALENFEKLNQNEPNS